MSVGSHGLVGLSRWRIYQRDHAKETGRFVIEMQKIPDRPDNMPSDQFDMPTTAGDTVDDTVAKSIPETRKDR